MRKVLTSLVLSSIILFLSSSSVFAVGTEPLKCPVGYFEDSSTLFNKFCCKNGSRAFWVDVFQGTGCFIGGVSGAPAEGIENGGSTNDEFCPNGNVWLIVNAVDKCYASGSEIEDGTYKGQTFLGCSTFITRSGKVGAVGTSLPMTFCDEGTARFGSLENTCVCEKPDGTSVVYEGVAKEDCQATCKEHGYVPAMGVLLRNPDVSCSTSTGGDGVLTAIGCIPSDSTGLANWAILFGSVIGGVIAVFKIIQGAFMVMTSVGDPDKLQEGRSEITAALVGLVVILAAVLLLNFLGFAVLGLGTFGFKLG